MKLQLTQEELEKQDESPLLRFLDSQRRPGEFDSTDDFSINLEDAQRKMGRFALPRPTAWILKFVQCANELRCDKLAIVLTRRTVEIRFKYAQMGNLPSMKNRFDNLRPQSRAEGHLFAALTSLKNMEGEVEVLFQQFRWDLESEPTEVAVESPLLRCICRPPRPSFFGWLRARLSLTVGLLNELQEFAYLSPMPIYLDGRCLTPSESSIPLVNGVLNDQLGTLLDVGGPFLKGRDDRSGVFNSWARSRSPKYTCIVRTEHRKQVEEPNIRLAWVLAGVVIKREEWQVRGSKLLFSRTLLSAEGLRFDLTGFNFVETRESKNRRRRAVYFTCRALQSLRGQLADVRQWPRFLESRLSELPFEPADSAELLAEVEVLLQALTPEPK